MKFELIYIYNTYFLILRIVLNETRVFLSFLRLKPQTEGEFKSFLNRTLEKNIHRRFDSSQLLTHGFFTSSEIPFSISDDIFGLFLKFQ